MNNFNDIIKNVSKRKLLILLFSFLMIINSVFVYLYFPERFKQQALQSAIDKTNTIADMGAVNIGSALYFDDLESAEQAVKSFKGVRDIVNVIVFNQKHQPTLIVNLDASNILKNEGNLFGRSGFSSEKKYYTTIKPISFNNKRVGYISVSLSLESIFSKVNESRNVIAFISLGMLITGLIGVILISFVFVKPLNNLMATFLQISKGNLSSRVKVDSKEEFGKLGEYFNIMADQVESTQKKLFEMNIALEEKVEERTSDLRNEIEERKKTENILRESEERIRNIFENAPFGIYQTTFEGKILFANPALVKMLKFNSLESMIKMDVASSGYLNDVDRILFLDKLIKESVINDYHAKWKANDGSIIYISENARLVKDDSGRIMYIEGMVEDISERLKAEEKLKENEEKYRNIFEKFQDVYFKFELGGIFVDLSPSVFNFSGYTPYELIGKSIDTVYQDRSKKFEFLKLLISNNKIVNFEAKFQRKTGEYINVNINAQFEFDKKGKPEFITGTLHDISYLKKIENQLIELNATKDKFFSIIAHDLRNPIGSFMQGTEILVHDIDNLEMDERTDIILSLNKTSKNLLELLENLLTWSRAQTGKISFTPDRADVFPIIRNNVSLLELQASNKRIELKSESYENTFGFFDVNMVNTVIRNLISNSIKFTPEGGTITIGSGINKEFIEVSIKDTGVGISDEAKDKLFKVGSASSTKGTANEKGTGLGLILCKELVEKNKGTIWVESRLGEGTTFTFTLPINKDNIN